MNKRIALTGAAALLLASGVPLVSAPGAQAGVSPSVIHVTQSGTTCVPSASNVIGNPGDSFSILVDSGCTAGGDATAGGAPVTPAIFYKRGASAQTLTLGASGSGTIELLTFPSTGGGTLTTTRISVTVTTALVAEPVVHDDLQQVGVPASGDCADVPITVGHYPGYPIGGWTRSWAMWIYNGTGGPVCTREVEETPSGEIILVD